VGGSPFRTGLIWVQCLSRQIAAWYSDRNDFIYLIIGSGRYACLILVSSFFMVDEIEISLYVYC
jgi:hypothetical protein